jgi:hypothetical protein
MTEDIHMLLGSYVLGGLSAEDRRAFDEHLEDCPRCRTELAEAAPLPALLRKVSGVPAMAAPPVAVEPSLDNLLVAARARRKRQFAVRSVAAAAAVLIAFGGGAAAAAIRGPDEGQLFALKASAGQAATGRIGLLKKDWGTSIWLQVDDMPRSGVFTMWATDDRGRTELAATWGGTPSGSCNLDGATSIAPEHIKQVSVLGPDQSVVAKAQP